MKIGVSFLKSNFDFPTTLNKIEKSTADLVHIDVMDGLFVNSKTIFDKEKLELLKKCQKPKEVHLMTLHSKNFIEAFQFIKPKRIIISYEATTDLENLIFEIKDKGINVGIAINPFTNVESILPYMNVIDEVLVMSVIPGYGGQKFLTGTIDKIKKLYDIRKNYNAKFLISVDGGIDANNISEIRKMIDIAITGSFVCQSANYDDQIKKLKGN